MRTEFASAGLTAGQLNAIVKKIGAPAAQELTGLLTMDQIAIEPIAKLVRDVGDASALAEALLKAQKVLKKIIE